MKRIGYFLSLGIFVLASCRTSHAPELEFRSDTTFPTRTVAICSTNYIVNGNIRWRRRIPYYWLAVEGPGRPVRRIRVATIQDREARAYLLLMLTKSLHNTDLFLPCAGQSAQNYVMLDKLILQLISQPFPYAREKAVATSTLDENNILQLLQQSNSGRYQLVDVTPTGPVILLDYKDTNNRYEFNLDLLKQAAFILEHFDGFLQVYTQLPTATARPVLFLLQSRADTSRFELIIRNQEGKPDYCQTGVVLSGEMGRKISVEPESTDPGVSIDGLGIVKLRKMIDPNRRPKVAAQNPLIPHENH